jgi:hypothetical protein
MPTVYNYHQVTKIFTEATDAHESPAEPGVWLLPNAATFVAPPPFTPPDQTAQWDGAAWHVIDAPIETVEEVIFGWTATDNEKRAVLMKLANDFMDGAARALGFASIVDASSMASPNPQNQYERDARTLRNWRTVVMTIINTFIDAAVGNTNPMPSVNSIMAAMPKFQREFPDPTQSPGYKIYGPVSVPDDLPQTPVYPDPIPQLPPSTYVDPPDVHYPVTPPDTYPLPPPPPVPPV